MAGHSDVIAADALDLELEVMRKHDYSWHPCQVYLSANGAGLVIKDGNNDSEDILVNENEALTRLRVRSLPLRDDDCTHIKEGDHVVVNRNSQSESCFFDAEVEKVARVRHSKRMPCRCTFMIKWLHQDLHGGSLAVPSSSIMRLANKSITNHPTISAFIDAVMPSNSSFSDMSPQLNVVNDIDLDLHDLLEKQIEGIRNSVHGSKKKLRSEILGLEANTNGQVKETGIFTSNVRVPELQISTDTSCLRRSNRNREASQNTEVKYPISPVVPSQSIEEHLPDNRSPLNPLAARAALASLMSKFPRTLEISVDDEEGKGLQSFNPACYSSSVIDDSSIINKLSSETETDLKGPRPFGIMRHDEKMNPEIETRSTRAAARKVKRPNDNFETSSCVVSDKSSTLKNRRLTRSQLRTEGESQTIETTSVIENDSSATCEKDTTPTARRKIPFKMESVGMKNSSDAKRVTRLSVNKEAANMQTEIVKESELSGGNDCILELNKSKTTGGKKKREMFGVAKATEETDRRSTNGNIDSLPTEQRSKKRNMSGVAITSQVSKGNVTSDGGCSYGSNKNSLNFKKHEVRSSPRSLPPKTRSQNKVKRV